jgi:hypothetical protein
MDTVNTSRWVKNALCTSSRTEQEFLDQISAAEHRRRIRDHIRHRENLHRRANLDRERRMKTVFGRKLKRRSGQEKGKAAAAAAAADVALNAAAAAAAAAAHEHERHHASLYERLGVLPSNKVGPDFREEDDLPVIVQSFQNAVRRVVPHLNLHLLNQHPLPEHIARTARKHVERSRRQKRNTGRPQFRLRI